MISTSGKPMHTGVKRKLDYSDLRALPDDDKRYELLEGALLVTPSPTTTHQWVSKRLERQLEGYFETRSPARVYHAPVDVILTPHDVPVPDIVVAHRKQIARRGIEGPPLLVVEILSPSTAARDRGRKMNRYAALGIRHYWIVDPDARWIECYHAAAGKPYRRVRRASGDGSFSAPGWPGLRIDLGAIWDDEPPHAAAPRPAARRRR